MLLYTHVVREGSLTAAARKLGITKQTVSERIANLERALGVRLLERTTRTLHTTDAGALYFERCVRIAEQLEEANREVQRLQVEPTGTLRVTATPLYGPRVLAPIVTSFAARYPRLRIELFLSDRAVNLVEEGFDVAVRIGELKDSTLMARRIGDGPLYYVASPRYLARHGVPRTAADLERARCISFGTRETWTVLGERVAITPLLTVNDLETAWHCVAGGLGIARLPLLSIGDASRRDQVRVVFGGPAASRPVHAVYPSRHVPAKVRLFVDAIEARLAALQLRSPRPARPASAPKRKTARRKTPPGRGLTGTS